MSADVVQGPVRTCVGCRQRAAKLELVRVVARDLGVGQEVVPDPAGTAPGRGAHLHPTSACLALALRRRAFSRALRTRGRGLDTTALEQYVLRSSPERAPGATAVPPAEPPAEPPTRSGSSSS